MGNVVIIAHSNPFTSLVDATDPTYQYVGEATPGSNVAAGRADTRWRIQRITKATGTVEWAGGGVFNQIWDNRASVTYA